MEMASLLGRSSRPSDGDGNRGTAVLEIPIEPKPKSGAPGVASPVQRADKAGEEKSSLAKTVTTIFISFVGAGVLALPSAFLRAGYVMGTACMSVVAGLALRAMCLLLRCKKRLEDQGCKTYSEVASICLGSSCKPIVEALLVTSQTGFCVAYLVFVSENLAPFTGCAKAVHVLIVTPFLMSVAFLPSLTALAPVSLAANLCNLIGMMVVLADDVAAILTSDRQPDRSHVVPVTSLSHLPFMFGVSVYCFEGIGMILPIEDATKDRAQFPMILSATVWAITLIFIVFGLMGYVAFGNDTQDMVTLNLPSHWSSTLMIFAVCTALILTFPVMMVPVYEIMERNLLSKDWFEKSVSPDNRRSVFNVLRCCIVGLVSFAAVSVPHFGDFISLIGSLCCGMLAFVVPAACHLMLFYGESTRNEKVLDILMIAFGVISAAFGTADSVQRMREVAPDALTIVPPVSTSP